MDLESRIERLEEKLDKNANKIMENMNRLHNHEEQINKNTSKIQKNSFALDILSDYKIVSKISFVFAVVGWLFAIVCLILVFIK